MDSFFEVSMELEKFHGVFAKLWQIGRPRFTDEIPTAAIAFNRDGGFMEFIFNPDFFDSLSIEERAAIVAHECLHVLLNHGFRMKNLIKEVANIAEDVVINELLVSGFGFDRNLPVFKTACFIDTVFPDGNIERNREMEYYYNELIKRLGGAENLKKMMKAMGFGTIDDHSNMPDSSDLLSEIENAIKGMSNEEGKKLAEKMEKSGEKNTKPQNMKKDDGEGEEGKEKKAFGQQAGTGSNFNWVVELCKPKVIKKWESIVKDWVIKAWRNRDVEQFIMPNRRFAILEARDNFMLPSENDREEDGDGMIDVVFFMDVSGSCAAISKKFFKSAKSIPRDKFQIDAYAFDTRVVKLDLKSDKMPYGGGTAFDILEEHLMGMKRYPSLVFVLTDGYGTKVYPKHPNRWHIFLTAEYKDCFPDTVHFHKFEDFSCD